MCGPDIKAMGMQLWLWNLATASISADGDTINSHESPGTEWQHLALDGAEEEV